MSWLSGLAATLSPRAAASARTSAFDGRRAEREHRVRELLGGQDAEHVALVLRPGGGAVQFAVAGGIRPDLGVVAGRDGVEAERERLLEQGGELDALVAAHARVGRAAGGVLGDEVVDDVELEALAEVPDVERDAEQVRGAARIHRVLDRAAAAGAGAQGAGVAAQREVHADHVVARLDGARGGDGAVDATAHRCQNSHGSRVPARAWAPRRDGASPAPALGHG